MGAFKGRSRGFDPLAGGSGHDEELLITPLLDLFVALIPLLIVGVVMSRINIVDVGVSKPVKSSQVKPNNFDLELKIHQDKAILKLGGKAMLDVPRDADNAWIEKIHTKLVEIKRENLDEYKLRIEPDNAIALETLMLVMDSARELKKSDGDLIKTEKDGTKIKVQFLFPSIILKGVYNS